MVEKFGTADYKPNQLSEAHMQREVDSFMSQFVKPKHGGCGGKASKSHNFKEMKNANKRRNEKYERE